MNRNFRKVVKLVIEITALVVIAADLALAVGLVLVSSRVRSERELHTSLSDQVRAEQSVVAHLQKTVDTLPMTEGQIRLFLDNHVPSRREAFARATRLIWALKQKSGVQLNGVGYKRDQRAQDQPLQRLALEVSLEGSFPNLLNFAHLLETASDFVVVRGCSFNPGEGGKLGLHVSADFYTTP